MIRYENDCVGCDIPCIDCGRKRTPHYYCDKCGWEYDTLYQYDDEQLCIDCLTSKFKKVSDEE